MPSLPKNVLSLIIEFILCYSKCSNTHTNMLHVLFKSLGHLNLSLIFKSSNPINNPFRAQTQQRPCGRSTVAVPHSTLLCGPPGCLLHVSALQTSTAAITLFVALARSVRSFSRHLSPDRLRTQQIKAKARGHKTHKSACTMQMFGHLFNNTDIL